MKCFKMLLLLAVAVVTCLIAAGCKTEISPEPFDPGAKLTVGQVKMSVKVGETTQMQVLKALGAPNMVSIANGEGEVWTYDQIKVRRTAEGYNAGVYFLGLIPLSSDFQRANSSGKHMGDELSILSAGAATPGFQAGGSTGTLTTSVNTATLIIRFDTHEKVLSYKMLATSF